MTTDINELVKRLNQWVDGFPSGILLMRSAASALEAMAGEVERLKDMRQFKQNLTAELVRLTKQLAGANAAVTNLANELASIGTERDRLKAALNKKLSASARQKLDDLSNSMIAMGDGRALEILLNWYDESRKALGGDA